MFGDEKRREVIEKEKGKRKGKGKEQRKISRLGKLRKLGRKGGGDVDINEKKKRLKK